MTTTTFCSSRSVSDSISELPNDIINQILMRLPQKDAVRTCILSTKWRYKWLAVPQLVFDYPSNYKLSPTEKNKLATAIYQALLLHHGHLIKFSFSVTDLDHKNSSDMNHWLHFLSKKVSISLNGMAEIAKYFKDKKTSNLIEMASSIPAIEELAVENYFLKFLAMGGVQNRLTKTLQHLRILHLSGICFEKIEEVSCALCLIRSSPNLEKLTIKSLRETNFVMKAVVEHLRVEDFLDCSLDQLRVAKMQLISGVRPELEFMKFLLATSTRLEKFEILPIQGKSFNCGFQRLKELIRFRRASAKAEIIYLDPDDLDK
ncbi:F-box/FBD/LRR-repeat protein At1g13570-like [Hevea brasiliensis]|uniref:F-box/FBD/LRR-repeat protein At1g13570-like n=1 Tax=Hevea brasiliensis TaxID=3981 RepID=UPI0025E5A380|nr:F-box/FBD/LRR-repeat protein At1g13570-like [Hevea brasiliensis]